MSMVILKPKTGSKTYEIAANAFAEMYEKVTGITLPVLTEDDGESDLVLIGSDAVNETVMNLYLAQKTDDFGIRYGTDDYCMRSYKDGKRKMLILAAGRGRAALYAVYDFFERFADCHYFWDGDVIPRMGSIEIPDVDITESPRFEYRGLRYFAHRGLWRFQAEHWSLLDWKREIDWMVKRRLNFFMLRIGMDDLWQRTFPETVPYPEKNEIAGGEKYNDRTTFWSLEYRGELRKKILEYALERDLMHPEDSGTMSHWYSPAPKEFLEAEKPEFLTQATSGYSNPQTLVWDIRRQRNMDNYMKLTDGYVREFNPNANIFHTIGLAERGMSEDREENMRMKLFTYRKIAECIREKYPNSKLMLAGWDLFFKWKPEEVPRLLSELDPERTLILDYEGEGHDPEYTFLNWGIVGKFPWIFGLFHGYEPESSLHGPYDRSDERLKVAAEDPMCKGMVIWPELSHTDPLLHEYLAENSWTPLTMKIEELAERMAYRRYGKFAEKMNGAWQALMPLIKAFDWGGNTSREESDPEWEKYIVPWGDHVELWSNPISAYQLVGDNHAVKHLIYMLNLNTELPAPTAKSLRIIAALPNAAFEDEFVKRDAVDLARTAVGRFMHFAIMKAIVLKYYHREEEIALLRADFKALEEILPSILAFHDDFSMNATLKRLKAEAPVNPNFETAMKKNLVNEYCAQYAYEPCKYHYPLETEELFDFLEDKNSKKPTKQEYCEAAKVSCAKFYARSLAEMDRGNDESFIPVLLRAADIIEKFDISLGESLRH